jgi:hypothetical protein
MNSLVSLGGMSLPEEPSKGQKRARSDTEDVPSPLTSMSTPSSFTMMSDFTSSSERSIAGSGRVRTAASGGQSEDSYSGGCGLPKSSEELRRVNDSDILANWNSSAFTFTSEAPAITRSTMTSLPMDSMFYQESSVDTNEIPLANTCGVVQNTAAAASAAANLDFIALFGLGQQDQQQKDASSADPMPIQNDLFSAAPPLTGGPFEGLLDGMMPGNEAGMGEFWTGAPPG